MRLLYILNDFPKLSETFVMDELTSIIDLGNEVFIIALNDFTGIIMHDDVNKYSLARRTLYLGKKLGLSLCNKYLYRPNGKEIFKIFLKELFSNRVLSCKEKSCMLDLYYDGGILQDELLDILLAVSVAKMKMAEHIHCHFAYRNVNIAYTVNKILGIPYTFTVHAYDIFVNPNKNLSKWAICAQKVITISHFNKNYMSENLNVPSQKIEIVNVGINLDKFLPIQEYPPPSFNIISLSRLIEKKGYVYLIKACGLLKDKKIEFNCRICGEGEEKLRLIQLIKERNLDQDIKIMGAVTRSELFDFINTGSIFVLPCIRSGDGNMDGMPVVLMESMAMEIPTISTDISGIPELIDNGVNGLIVPQKDPEALASAILKIKDDPYLANTIRKNGREKIIEKFDIKKNIKKLINIFKNEQVQS